MTTTFNDIETGSRFYFHCMYFQKENSSQAMLISDQKYEQGRAKFVPFFSALVFFNKPVIVEPVDKELNADIFIKKHGTPTRKDWPADKHPG